MPSLLSLTFDDGFRCQFDDALPILNEHGIPATFFLIANQQPTHENHRDDWWKIDWSDSDIAMLKQAVRDGHEVGSHTVTHDRNKMRKQPEVETRESKKLIEDWLQTEISSFCYPFYDTYAYLTNAARDAGYEQARKGRQNSYYTLSDPLDFNVDCREVSTTDRVTEWTRPDSWHVVTFHGIGNDRSGWAPIPIEQFAAMVSELAELRESGRVEILNFKEGAKRFKRSRR
jgi:peptidoglycan/xylan/chitin deacetylase (PgdA/CDA1 family)